MNSSSPYPSSSKTIAVDSDRGGGKLFNKIEIRLEGKSGKEEEMKIFCKEIATKAIFRKVLFIAGALVILFIGYGIARATSPALGLVQAIWFAIFSTAMLLSFYLCIVFSPIEHPSIFLLFLLFSVLACICSVRY